MFRLVCLIYLISAVHGQIQLAGNCSTDLQYEKGFNVTEFSGNWYEFERIDNTFETGACSSFTLTRVLTHNRNYMFVSNQEVVDGKLSIRNGVIIAGFFNYRFAVAYSDGVSYDVVVLKTNLKDFAVIYSCKDTTNGKAVLAWKLSRTQTPSSTAITEFDTVIKSYPDLVNATWFAPSHSKKACTIRNVATNLGLSSTLFALFGIFMSKNL
ncbi:apolipoprotein D-like [Melitaea cinxia]|uniref:apolipoprotein D-like n=1 Tax=Melitaea cinxia TaxID=113334 RepID=UPI001E2735DA|nr:apolipoprotein D-like [Melitaea cinxia]